MTWLQLFYYDVKCVLYINKDFENNIRDVYKLRMTRRKTFGD